MKKLLLTLSLIILGACQQEPSKADLSGFPKEMPRTVYLNEHSATQDMRKCDLSVYEGKVIKSVEVNGENDVIMKFEDGKYMYISIYKYPPKLKFFKQF